MFVSIACIYCRQFYCLYTNLQTYSLVKASIDIDSALRSRVKDPHIARYLAATAVFVVYVLKGCTTEDPVQLICCCVCINCVNMVRTHDFV